MNRFPSNAGIAIGPILFMLAVLGVIAAVVSAGGGSGLGSAGVADRITADVVGQANLIRSKIGECYMQYIVNGTNYATAAPCLNDAYPCSDQTNGTDVAALTCPNDPLTGGGDQQSLWTGLRFASLPIATKGFANWTYINAGESGGRCIWTAPASGAGSAEEGLTRAAKKFSSQEVAYDPASNTQKFVVFITKPTGAVDSHCTVP